MSTIRKILFALIAVAIAVLYLWHTKQVVIPKDATWDDVLSEAGRANIGLLAPIHYGIAIKKTLKRCFLWTPVRNGNTAADTSEVL